MLYSCGSGPPPTGAPPNKQFPAGLLKCDAGTPPLKTSCANPARLHQLNSEIRTAIRRHYDSLSKTCNNVDCPRGDLAGCFVRLVGHDIMDYSKALNSGGADGCIDFQDHDNRGLQGCMLRSVHERDSSNVSLELMYQDFCSEVSIADFFVIAAEALMTLTAPHQDQKLWSGSFGRNFRFGRTTELTCAPKPLPNPKDSCDANQGKFMEEMGLTAHDLTALLGVHTLGRALPENSGFDGFWVSHQGGRTFDNQYYRAIIAVGWTPGKVADRQRRHGETSVPDAVRKSQKVQWVRADVDPAHPLAGEMMLNTDM